MNKEIFNGKLILGKCDGGLYFLSSLMDMVDSFYGEDGILYSDSILRPVWIDFKNAVDSALSRSFVHEGTVTEAVTLFLDDVPSP